MSIPIVSSGQVHGTFPEDSTKEITFSVKTNMLYDLALIPNVGAEFHIAKDWSVAANWHYAWWDIDREHYYWRTYGGDISFRKWFNKKKDGRRLTGHHLGLYAQIITYDFEIGKRGYLSDKWTYGGGVEYGYSLPVGRHLNIDFSLGLGYMTGEYMEYDPIDDCYVWQFTKQQQWFGPTKAEISLVWILNVKKGGAR